MNERSVDISSHRSKDVTEFWKQRVQYVITVCDKAKEACPIFPFALTKLHWSLEDPAAAQGTEAERLAVFRRVRDQIEDHVREFVAKES
jgi:arsenate reductase (thioredoxin)